jgi:hypothetical protein
MPHHENFPPKEQQAATADIVIIAHLPGLFN